MTKKLYIGPHVPLEETFYSTLEKFKKSYPMFNTIQIFMGPPVGYHIRRTTEETLHKTGQFLKDHDMKLYVHAPYVINLASQEPDILEKGRTSLQKLLHTQSKIAEYSSDTRVGTVLHVGAKGPLSQVINEINDLMLIPNMKSGLKSNLYLENAAQHKLGQSFDDLRKLSEGIDSHRVGFCIDTCHTHSSGLADMRSSVDVLKLFDMLDELNHRPITIHLNDSKTKFKSKQDKHSILGYGHIWDVETPESFDSLFTLLELCKTHSYDVILETPSIDIQTYEYEIMKAYF